MRVPGGRYIGGPLQRNALREDLNCIKCDMQVLCFQGCRWDPPAVNYVFFRNNIFHPDRLLPVQVGRWVSERNLVRRERVRNASRSACGACANACAGRRVPRASLPSSLTPFLPLSPSLSLSRSLFPSLPPCHPASLPAYLPTSSSSTINQIADPRSSAYACQCSWQSVSELKEISRSGMPTGDEGGSAHSGKFFWGKSS